MKDDLLLRALKVERYLLSRQLWTNSGDMARDLNLAYKTSYRWLKAAQQVLPLEVREEHNGSRGGAPMLYCKPRRDGV